MAALEGLASIPRRAARVALHIARLLKPRRMLDRLGRKVTSDSLRQITGRSPRRLLRLSTLAMMIGDYERALALTEPVAGRSSEHDLAVYLIAEWEAGDPDRALAHAQAQLGDGGAAKRRAVARFHLYIEDPEEAERVLGELDEPGIELALEIAQRRRRRGELDRALEVLDRIEAIRSDDERALHLRAAVTGERETERRAGGLGQPPRAPARTSGPILHLVSRSLPHHHAGSTYRTHYLVGAQRRHGWDAQVATECGFPASSAAPSEQLDGITYHRLGGEPADHRLDSRIDHHVERAEPLVAELKPAVLHPASDYRNALVALELGDRHGVPVVYEVRGFPEEYLSCRPGSRLRRDPWALRRELEAECWRRADHIVTLAEVMKEHIASKGVDRDRITVVPNAVDVARFQPSDRDQGVAAGLGLSPGEPVVGYISSLSPYEGIRYLIEAAGHLSRAGHAAKVLVVGDGSESVHLQQLTRRLGLEQQVIFTGRVDHAKLPAYYELIDVFVVPRTMEATTNLVTPLKPFEAMAMSKPVVAARTAALSEVVADGETGLLFEPENAAELAGRLEALLSDETLARELGEAGRAWVTKERTWGRNAERYDRLYRSLGVEPGDVKPVTPARLAAGG